MPDHVFIGQQFFEQNEAGWSEGYNIISDSYDNAMVKLQAIASKRLHMFNTECKATYLRVSQIDKKRDTVVRTIGSGVGPGDYSPALEGAVNQQCPPDDALLMRFQTADPSFGLHYLRSVPEIINDAGVYVPEANFTTAFQDWDTAVCANAVQKVPDGAGGHLYQPILFTEIIRITRRKVGRPFGAYRGRSVRP